ncbi:hypothetical protein DPMN_193036 [Dreissena polymorpha]|uniref:Uncharacterized protein n=1 Tax=Dreissena polymorpha TaxID=45954 RepID=A0A9D3Y1B0_DREPO|nr:hypothetical protein DPMN_193036 [Dreissena polymorpha]
MMESPVRERMVVDIRKMVEKQKHFANDLLPAHSISERDTVAEYFGISKGKVAKMLIASMSKHGKENLIQRK